MKLIGKEVRRKTCEFFRFGVFWFHLLLQRRQVRVQAPCQRRVVQQDSLSEPPDALRSRAVLNPSGGLFSVLSLVPVSCWCCLLLRTVFCFSLLETRINASSSLCSLQPGSPNGSARPYHINWLSQILLFWGNSFCASEADGRSELPLGHGLSQQPWPCHLRSMNSRLVGQSTNLCCIS